VVGGLGLQEAIDAPSFHTTSVPSSFYPREMNPGELVAEDRLGPDVLTDLEARGHGLVRAGGWTLGRLCAVARDADSGALSAASDPRGAQCYSVGR
jgi:gamma-glutamyltranspeptidase/glutathione hydrolase